MVLKRENIVKQGCWIVEASELRMIVPFEVSLLVFFTCPLHSGLQHQNIVNSSLNQTPSPCFPDFVHWSDGRTHVTRVPSLSRITPRFYILRAPSTALNY